MHDVSDRLYEMMQRFADLYERTENRLDKQYLLDREKETRLGQPKPERETKAARAAVTSPIDTSSIARGPSAPTEGDALVEQVDEKYLEFAKHFRGFNPHRQASREALDRHLAVFDQPITIDFVRSKFDWLLKKVGRKSPWGAVAICNAIPGCNIAQASAYVMFLQWATLCQYDKTHNALVVSSK